MRIAVFCLPGLQAFINPVIRRLERNHVVQKVYTDDMGIVLEEANKADVIWLEWANELAIQMTNTLLKHNFSRKVILRVHSYEILQGFLELINWDVVSDTIFVNKWMRDKYRPDAHYIPNGVDLERFVIDDSKKQTTNIAWLGSISYKKGFQLLIQAAMAIPNKYKVHVGGEFHDKRLREYFLHICPDNVVHCGRISDVNKWYSDKSYVLCTSPWESQNMAVMEGMACGAKPIIHDFPGAESIYGPDWLWRSIADVETCLEQDVAPGKYRCYVQEFYSMDQQMDKIEELVL